MLLTSSSVSLPMCKGSAKDGGKCEQNMLYFGNLAPEELPSKAGSSKICPKVAFVYIVAIFAPHSPSV